MKNIWRIIVYIFAFIGFVLVAVFLSVQFGFTNEKGIVDQQHDYFLQQLSASSTSIWSSEEWSTLKTALLKDKSVIERVSKETGVPSRYIVSILIVEQLRLFNSEREVYKQIFAPLKILGNQSQFSWGVMGIKQDTAKETESNLRNPISPFYLGKENENKLDYHSGTDMDEERFARLTNEDDRYYSYLYGAIFIKEIISQWKKAGFPIHENIGVIATLYNIGFKNSIPKENPQVGGAEINISSQKYSFGSLAQAFYYSDQLLIEFPR